MTCRRAAVLALVVLGAGRAALAQPPPGEVVPPPDNRTPPPVPVPDPEPEPEPDPVPVPVPVPDPVPPVTDPEKPAAGAIERATLGAPSAQWTTWSIQGRLLENLDSVA